MKREQLFIKNNLFFVFFIMIIFVFCFSSKVQAKEFDGESQGQTVNDLIEYAAVVTNSEESEFFVEDDEIKLTANIKITYEKPTTGNALVVGRDLTIDLNGKTLIIETTVANSNGIKIANKSTLTIIDSSPRQTGSLEVSYEKATATATRSGTHPGFGAGINTTDGMFVVKSGGVAAISNGDGAGIGGGMNATGGTVTIHNGHITAESLYGAGIGGGMNGSGGNITIQNGDITAKSTNGAGIGGGMANETGGIIFIGDGVITAESNTGAGIGGGMNGSAGVVTMAGGQITVASEHNAAIGGNGKSVGMARISGGSLMKSGDAASAKWETPLTDFQGTRVYPIPIEAKDSISQTPLVNITISVIYSSYTAFANASGYACIWLPDRIHTINFSVPNYMSINQMINPVELTGPWAITLDRIQVPEIDGEGGNSNDYIVLPFDYNKFTKKYEITGISTPTVTVSEDQNRTMAKISDSGLLQIPNGLTSGTYMIKIKASNGSLPDAVMTIQIEVDYPEGKQHPVKDFITRLYDGVFLREPDAVGLDFWYSGLVKQKIDASETAHFFFTSPEMQDLKLSDIAYIERLYVVMMGRENDEAGLYFWLDILENGATRGEILDHFLYSEEFTKIILSFGLKA